MIITIGIDVSKSKLDIWTSDNKFTVIKNDHQAIVDYFKQFKIANIVLEATGKYHRLAHKTLSNLGLHVMVINPYMSRNFARAMNLLCKTDKVDAKMLCFYGQTMDFKNTKVSSDDQELLQELSRRKEQLQGDIVRETNRLKVTHQAVATSVKQHIEFLKQQIAMVEQELSKIIAQNDNFKSKLEILLSVPGVGKNLALTLISYLPELGTISRRKISALTGLAPINNDSGKVKGKRSIQKGRFAIRRALYMPILSAIRNNKIIKNFYQNLKQQGKPGKVAITACMRKLITILNIMLKNNTKWNIAS